MPTIRSDGEKMKTERTTRVELAWHGLEGRPLTTSTSALLPNGRENGAADGSRTHQILLTMEALSHESSDGV